MKKRMNSKCFFSLMVVCVILFCFSACGEYGHQEETQSPQGSAEPILPLLPSRISAERLKIGMTYDEVVDIMEVEPICLVQYSSVMFEFQLDDGTFLRVGFERYKPDMRDCILSRIYFGQESHIDLSVAMDSSLQQHSLYGGQLKIGMTYDEVLDVMGREPKPCKEESASVEFELEDGAVLHAFFNRYKPNMEGCVLSMVSIDEA